MVKENKTEKTISTSVYFGEKGTCLLCRKKLEEVGGISPVIYKEVMIEDDGKHN